MEEGSPKRTRPPYDTQYDEAGDRYVFVSKLKPDVNSTKTELEPAPEEEEDIEVVCLQYRDTLAYKWYNSPKHGHLRISFGGAGDFFVFLSRFEDGEWVPISKVFHPQLEQGPYDVFVPPAQYGPPHDVMIDPPPEFDVSELMDLIEDASEQET